MGAGDITASGAVACKGATEVVAAVEDMNLAAATDFIFIIPVNGRDDQYFVFKAERE